MACGGPGVEHSSRAATLLILCVYSVVFCEFCPAGAIESSRCQRIGDQRAFQFVFPVIAADEACDRHWGRPIWAAHFFLSALLFYAGAYTGYAVAEGIEAMYVARFLQGLAASLMLITVDTMTSDVVETEQRGQEMGANIQVQVRASIVGATIGFSLVASIPLMAWKYSFSLFAGIALLGFIYAFFRLPETGAGDKAMQFPRFKVTEDFRRLLGVLFLMGLANALIQPIYLIYLQDNFTTDPRILSWAFLPSALVYMVLPARLGAIADSRGPMNLLLLGLLLAGALYVVMPRANAFWPFVVLYTVSAIGWAMVEPARKSIVASHATSSAVARTFGMSEMYYGVGTTVGPLLGGYIYDNVSQTAPYYVNGGLMVCTAVCAFLMLRTIPASR